MRWDGMGCIFELCLSECSMIRGIYTRENEMRMRDGMRWDEMI